MDNLEFVRQLLQKPDWLQLQKEFDTLPDLQRKRLHRLPL